MCVPFDPQWLVPIAHVRPQSQSALSLSLLLAAEDDFSLILLPLVRSQAHLLATWYIPCPPLLSIPPLIAPSALKPSLRPQDQRTRQRNEAPATKISPRGQTSSRETTILTTMRLPFPRPSSRQRVDPGSLARSLGRHATPFVNKTTLASRKLVVPRSTRPSIPFVHLSLQTLVRTGMTRTRKVARERSVTNSRRNSSSRSSSGRSLT